MPRSRIPTADEFDEEEDEVEVEQKTAAAQKAQSLKEAEAFYKLVHTALLPLRRNLHDVSENLIAQLEKSEEHEGVILGAEEVHDKYRTDMLDLARDCQSALEALIKAQLWFKRGGYVEGRSNVRTDKLLTPFSVRASERAAVQLAKKIAPLFKGIGILRSDNCAELVGRLVSLTGLPTIRIQAMLSHLMPLRIDNMALFRLSLAIVEYLPLFDKDDNSYDGAYRGNPPVWTHVRVLSARALNGGVSRTVQLVLLRR